MKRRTFIGGMTGAALWPVLAHAQQSFVPVIGFLSGRSQDEASGDTAAFRQGLKEMGYEEGRNVAVEYRWAEGRNELLPDWPHCVPETISRRARRQIQESSRRPLGLPQASREQRAYFQASKRRELLCSGNARALPWA